MNRLLHLISGDSIEKVKSELEQSKRNVLRLLGSSDHWSKQQGIHHLDYEPLWFKHEWGLWVAHAQLSAMYKLYGTTRAHTAKETWLVINVFSNNFWSKLKLKFTNTIFCKFGVLCVECLLVSNKYDLRKSNLCLWCLCMLAISGNIDTYLDTYL